MTLCYVSDHWAQYISITGAPMQEQESFSREKLQVEFDELFLRAVLHVLKAKRWVEPSFMFMAAKVNQILTVRELVILRKMLHEVYVHLQFFILVC